MEEEIWKDLPDYPKYEISNFGNLRNKLTGRFKNQRKDSSGYLRLSLWDGKTYKVHKIHVLVCDAFIGPCPKGLVRNHIDHNRCNNKASNFEYVTVKENNRQGREFRKKNHDRN